MNPLAIRADAVNIIAPLIPSPCRGWPVRVTGASPLSHRRAVYIWQKKDSVSPWKIFQDHA